MDQANAPARAETPQPTETENGSKGNGLAWGLGVSGVVLAIAGIAVGSTEVGYCGTPFAPDDGIAQLRDTLVGLSGNAAACPGELAGPTMMAWALTLLGVALFVAGLIVGNVPRRAPVVVQAAPAARTAADRLDDLDRLQAAGAVTEAEYASKRADILRDL
ncbi:hypothetical protein ACX8Z9_04650 [Arthrobacter halodurans]|uniref:Short C-terminal domain-containing protein n=1 Tax=Arthrobacter halodurans TaxID=516699 RepID=A0ABV4UQJ8_9MICC